MIAPKLISILRRNQVNRSRLYLKLHFIVSGSFNGLYLVNIINIYIFFQYFRTQIDYITSQLSFSANREGQALRRASIESFYVSVGVVEIGWAETMDP